MMTAKWFLRSIISFLVLQGVLGDDAPRMAPECPSYDPHDSTDHRLGHVTSPDYIEKGEYPSGSRCESRIHIPHGHSLKLYVSDLDIEPSDFCSHASLQINDTLTVRTLCGTIQPYPIFVEEGVKYVHLSFRSDQNPIRPGQPTRRGFSLLYQTAPDLVQCPGRETCGNGNCYDESMKCDGQDECGDGTDEEGCDLLLPIVGCGEVMVGPDPDTVFEQPDETMGEKEVHRGSWPWQVSLQNRYTDFSHTCGGTLISAQWILTAARCLKVNPDPNNWQVHVGVHHKYQEDDYAQIRYIERIIVWPNKTGDDLLELGDNFDSNDDIALVKLQAAVQLGFPYVNPACLPQSGRDVQPGTRCYAAGWGATGGTGSDDVLKLIDLPVMSKSNCSYDPSSQICVKNPGCPSACNGDSGNPLVAKFGSKWYVVGIGSNRAEGNNRSAATNETIIYTRVSDKAEWIRKMVDKYS